MQNLLGYGGESYVQKGVIKHYVGDARLSWMDCDDVAAVAAVCLAQPEPHAGKTYRMGYEAKTYYELAEIFTKVLGAAILLRTAAAIRLPSKCACCRGRACIHEMRV